MPAPKAGTTRAFAIADAESVLKASGKHWPVLQKHGAAEVERKRFEATIAEAKKLEQQVTAAEGEASALEESRQKLKDSLGEFRAAAHMVARNFDGPNPAAERALKVSERFPVTDATLRTFLRGLDKSAKTYAAKLAERGFSKEAQAALQTSTVAFVSALDARGKQRGDQRSMTVSREAVFGKLAYQTRYFRDLGRLSLRTFKDRADFDRVKPKATRKPQPKAPPPPPPPPPA